MEHWGWWGMCFSPHIINGSVKVWEEKKEKYKVGVSECDLGLRWSFCSLSVAYQVEDDERGKGREK